MHTATCQRCKTVILGDTHTGVIRKLLDHWEFNHNVYFIDEPSQASEVAEQQDFNPEGEGSIPSLGAKVIKFLKRWP